MGDDALLSGWKLKKNQRELQYRQAVKMDLLHRVPGLMQQARPARGVWQCLPSGLLAIFTFRTAVKFLGQDLWISGAKVILLCSLKDWAELVPASVTITRFCLV